ncbi:hypothetical protein [Virgibacillus necropolis]|uniref:hypothetical protein n=1 Tax=Virgibacillus necropolis TaxID=163877 RepID=UPI0013747A9B|nr:hypothetical protein [Virgibacillus necropolis]
MTNLPILFVIAFVVTIFEVFLAIYLIKKQNIKPSRALFMSVPSVVIIWFVAIIAS